MRAFIKSVCFVGWLTLLAVVVNAYRTNAQGLTFSTNSYNGGSVPYSVVAADVNGDGKVDLICPNLITSTLTVLTNNGFGIFGSNATLSVGTSPIISPYSVTAADVNGDGKVDLICGNAGNNTLTVFTNNGSGSFVLETTLNLGNALDTPVSVIAADLSGTGRMDLVNVNNNSPGTLTIFTNNGFGLFGSNVTLNVGNYPWCVIAADVNGDGKPDLITANGSDNTLTVLTNNGSGGFGSNAILNVGDMPRCVVAADINGDGKVDLISANWGDNTLTVWTNNGTGVFGSNATLNVGNGPFSVAAADINGDGKVDLISANENDNTLTVLTNNGFGVFGSNVTLNVGNQPTCVIATDVNGDGKLDLISANSANGYTNTLTVLVNTTIFPPPTLNIVPAGDGVMVSWPLFASEFSLQTNADLTTPNWGTPGYTPSTKVSLKALIFLPHRPAIYSFG
jgi:FG-GAP-like repeat